MSSDWSHSLNLTLDGLYRPYLGPFIICSKDWVFFLIVVRNSLFLFKQVKTSILGIRSTQEQIHFDYIHLLFSNCTTCPLAQTPPTTATFQLPDKSSGVNIYGPHHANQEIRIKNSYILMNILCACEILARISFLCHTIHSCYYPFFKISTPALFFVPS